jgi:hypothetical protein
MHRVAELLCRRGNRTQPGVLTPGTSQPAFVGCKSDTAQESNTSVLQNPAALGFEHSLSAIADGSGRDPLRVDLALVLRSFSEGGSEAALHEIAAWRRRKDDDEDENDVPQGDGRNGLMDGWLDQRPLLKQQFCRPFRAVRLFGLSVGLKPQAESNYPFGISPLGSSETTGFVSMMRRFTHSHCRRLASPSPP